jgi:hypothetical protein
MKLLIIQLSPASSCCAKGCLSTALLFYLYDGHVLPRHGGLLLEEIVGGALGRPHSPDARHGGYPGLFSSTAFGTRTTMFL